MLSLAVLFAVSALQVQPVFGPPPGSYWTSWIGNSFPGDGGDNGRGFWVQDAADEIEVTPDGTVIAGCEWDEAGRCLGLYKNGKPSQELLKVTGSGSDGAWGWGTGNNAVAVVGNQILAGTTGKSLIRFTWTPGDIESAKYVDRVALGAAAVGLSANASQVAVVYPTGVELRRLADLSAIKTIPLADAKDVAFGKDGSLWALAGKSVFVVNEDGTRKLEVPGLAKPTAIAIDPKGRLVVCEEEQVLIFAVSGSAPKLVATFGAKGGLMSGVPGEAKPNKLFGLHGASYDAGGNLYVSMSFDKNPGGGLWMRSFTPSGALRWSIYNNAFVDTFGFDPNSDGATVYSRDARYDLNLNTSKPGAEATLTGFTVDPVGDSTDRSKVGKSVVVRNVSGHKLLYTIGQYSGGFTVHTFDQKGLIAKPVDTIGINDTWAWYVDEKGTIWQGDGPNATVRHWPILGWSADGKPRYDWKSPVSEPRPVGWGLVRRVLYQAASDQMIITGYLENQKSESWGVLGATARCYSHWSDPKKRAVVWTNDKLPVATNDAATDPPFTPQAIDWAGDYFFLGMVKPTAGKMYVHVMSAKTGKYVGSFEPGAHLGQHFGWLDMPFSVQALKRRNGEYLILAEEDWRGKNLLYRWRP